ncbi:MAG: hypothetical protein UMU75_08560 [Halomonas sp.]|nr:hypothetical protein [Halomonas sp.]
MTEKKPLPVEEASYIAILKRLEETGIIESSGYQGLSSLELLVGFTNYWGHRLDVARQSASAYDQGKELVSESDFSDIRDATTSAFRFGVELGKLLAKLEYPLSPEDVLELIEWKNKIDRTRKNSEAYKEGKDAVIKEARGYALAYWRLHDKEDEIRSSEMASIVFEHLVRRFTPDTKEYRHIADFNKTSGTKQVKEWIKPVTPPYAKKGGRPSKK